jgi:hypothetical protein
LLEPNGERDSPEVILVVEVDVLRNTVDNRKLEVKLAKRVSGVSEFVEINDST